MDKRLIVPMFFLCLGLVGNSARGDLKTGLVAHWAFEGNFNDSEGTNHATPHGNAKIATDAIHGRVTEFDGDGDYLQIPNSPSLNITGDQITLASWVYFDDVAGDPEIVIAKAFQDGQHTSPYFSYGLHMLSNGTPRFWLSLSVGSRNAPGSPNFESGRWYHMAGVYDGSQMILYVDGEVSATNTNASGTLNGYDRPLFLGINGGRGEPMDGKIDDVVIYNRALTQEEIQQVMQGLTSPALASDANPENEATDVPRDVVLSWTPGQYAPAVNGHRVYFSENFSDVNNSVGGATVSPSSYDPGRLEFNTTYYWRVDEVNAPPDSTVFRGEIWSFTTEPMAYPIDGANIIATASSTSQGDFGPEKTIDGSGLDENGLHSTEPTDMWLSDNEPQGAWIQYEFGKVYKLHEMWVWNSNQIFEALFGFGLKAVTVEYSTNGTDWIAVAGVSEFAQAPGTSAYVHNTTVDFGGEAVKYVRLTASSNWGGLLPQFGLSEVRFFSIPVTAREPSPDSGATDVNPNVTLTWRAGREAATHDVYLSSDQQAVIDGTTPVVNVTGASYSTALDLASTYYWRVDEVNEAETLTTWQGDVWSFSTLEYLVVDDFEDYNDYPPYEVYSTWLDGYENPANGSQVGYLTLPSVETTIVHSGNQSMPLLYGNTGGATYSEATRTFAIPQDWTTHGIQTLGLWFHGAAGNTGQLYVKINGVKVSYDGDAGNLATTAWQPWNIDLTTLGVNLASVTTLAIGIDGNAAAGTLYFDDIRLYAYSRQLVTPTDPGNAGLVAQYKLDQNANDSSGNGHNGTVEGAPTWSSPGRDGTGACMRFGGDADRITVQSFDVTGSGITLAAWIRPVSFKDDARMISKSQGSATSAHYWAMVLSGTGENNLQFRLRTDAGATTSRTSAEGTDVQADEWTHVAVTWDASDPVMRLHKNGIEIDSVNKAGSAVGTSAGVQIGIGNQSVSAGPAAADMVRPFDGFLDEVRVYERGLSVAELAWLGGRTQPFDEPL